MRTLVLVDDKPVSCKACLFYMKKEEYCLLTMYDSFPEDHCPLIVIPDRKWCSMDGE